MRKDTKGDRFPAEGDRSRRATSVRGMGRSRAAVLALGLLLAAGGRVHAIPLDPLAFKSLGPLVANTGEIKINTDGDVPSLTVGGKSFAGVLVKQGAGLPDVAVFTFTGIGITGDVTITGTGSRPLALLSRGDIAIDAPIDLSGGIGGLDAKAGAAGSFGGGKAGQGPGAGINTSSRRAGLAGGSFGGRAGTRLTADINVDTRNPYGDLAAALQGGSGGAPGTDTLASDRTPLAALHAGGGAGAIEIGAVGSVAVSAIFANGGRGALLIRDHGNTSSSGGGSGGAILLHGANVSATRLEARGGTSPLDDTIADGNWGFGGGGGRVLLAPGFYSLGFPPPAADLRGGASNPATSRPGETGVYDLRPALTEIQARQVFRPASDGTLAFADGPTLHTLDIVVRQDASMVAQFDYTTTGKLTFDAGSGFTAQGALVIDDVLSIAEDASVLVTGSARATAALQMAGGIFFARGGLTSNSVIAGHGQVAGHVTGASGSAIRAESGTLVVGDANEVDAIAWNGSFAVLSSAEKPATLQLDSKSVVVLGDTSLHGASARVVTAKGAVVAAGGTLSADSDSAVAGTVRNDGRVVGPTSGPGFLSFEGEVSGTGSYAGSVEFSGRFSPGASPALVHADSIAFDTDNVLFMELGGRARGAAYDAIDATGTITLGGTLQVVLLSVPGGLFLPASGDTFDLLAAASIDGGFASLVLPTLASGLKWQADIRATDGGEVFRLAVTSAAGDTPAVPEPAEWVLMATGALLLAGRVIRKQAKHCVR